MIKILGISGSLRAKSFNTALLRAAKVLSEESMQVDVATLHGIPLYDGDLEESQGTPDAVHALKAQILASDGLLLVTPEYNNGVPGVFKNAVDWLSRPTPGMPAVFPECPVALIGTSPGGFGTILAQNHWLPVLKTLGVRQWNGGRLMVSRAQSVFDSDGQLIDETVKKQVADFMHGFGQFVHNNPKR